jgi:hypothetical protein
LFERIGVRYFGSQKTIPGFINSRQNFALEENPLPSHNMIEIYNKPVRIVVMGYLDRVQV